MRTELSALAVLHKRAQRTEWAEMADFAPSPTQRCATAANVNRIRPLCVTGRGGRATEGVSVPGSLEELRRQFDVARPDDVAPLRHRDPRDQEDIHFSVLHNLIHVSSRRAR